MTMVKKFKGKGSEKGPNINEEISASQIRVIDDEGKMLGVLSRMEALSLAKEKGLDLIEVNPNGNPIVAKIIDYGKYKYELKKKMQEAKKNQVVVSVKEVQFRPKIDTHDFEFKMKHISDFIKDGDKVKICITFKGREIAHPEMADPLIDKILASIIDYAVVDSEPKREGKRIQIMISPRKA